MTTPGTTSGQTSAEDQASTLGANTLFEQPWWLEAVAPGRWGACEVEQNGALQARLPFVALKRRGLTLITRPPFTPALGPWLRDSESRDVSSRRELIVELIGQLPPYDYLEQPLSPVLTDWLPFYWSGFESRVHYTSRLEQIDDQDLIDHGLTTAARRSLRKARSQLTTRDDLGVDVMYELVEATFKRQGLPTPWSASQVERLDRACAARGARHMLFAVDASESVQAGAYFVFDEGLAYYLFGGATEQGRALRAQSLLMREGIRFAATVSRGFDFEGSMIEPIERFFRSFGPRQVPYFTIRRASRRMRLLFGLRDAAQAARGR